MACVEGAIMGQAPIYARINRPGLCSSKVGQSPHPGPAVMRAGNRLAVVCLCFGAALAVFVSGSLGLRIRHLFFFVLIPLVGCCVGGTSLFPVLIFAVAP